MKHYRTRERGGSLTLSLLAACTMQTTLFSASARKIQEEDRFKLSASEYLGLPYNTEYM